MYRSHLTIFAAIAATLILSLPAANLALRSYIGGPLWSYEVRDLWSLDRIEGSVAYLLMSCCDKSPYPNRVRVGQNGYLFLGDEFADVMSKASGDWQPPAGLIDDRAARFARLQQKVTNAGATLAIVIAPNKHSIYPEMLPPDLTAAQQTATDELVIRAADMDVPILDLRPELRRLKATAQAYFKTDTHWTHAGAAASYDSIMEILRDHQGGRVTPVSYTLAPVDRPASDLTVLLKMQDMFGPAHETDYDISFAEPLKMCLSTISLISGDESECEATSNGDVSVEDRSIKVTRTENAPNDQTLLMLCDSFCAASSSLFNASFKTVYRVHWNYLDDAALNRNLETLAPDIVVLQVVERDVLAVSLGLN